MEEYLEKLISQIRCKKARPYILEEIKGHIEDQIQDNIAVGMTKEEALFIYRWEEPRIFPVIQGSGYTIRKMPFWIWEILWKLG